MKNRKHKNNKQFKIQFQRTVRTASGKTRRLAKEDFSIVTDSKGGALRAFRFGLDAHNIQIFSIAESPL